MATIKHPHGKADTTATPTGTADRWAFGPPASGHPFMRGLYVKQDANTLRWIEDQWTPGTAAPSSFSYPA